MVVDYLSDLDALVLRCRDAKARSYIDEAVVCLKAGAFRAAIVVTWVAVVHDLRTKLEQLAFAGDKNAQKKVENFRQIVSDGDLQASLNFERTILEIARDEFELFGLLAYQDLSRLREDRHRCAHPSMLDPDTDYQPVPELARCHMVNAVTHLLQHGPAQGKAALDRLMVVLDQVYFPKSIDELVVHLEHGPLGNPRTSLVQNFVIVLLKQYFAEPAEPPDNLLEAIRYRSRLEQAASRTVWTLAAVLRMHREVALEAFKMKLDGLVAQAADVRLSAFLLLAATISDAWLFLSPAQQNRIKRYVREMPTVDFESALKAAWSIPSVQSEARELIFSNNNWSALAKVDEPPAEWIQIAIDNMSKASNWEEANPPRVFLRAVAHLITEEQTKALLRAASQNTDLQSSWGVKDTLAALFRSSNMGPERVKALIEDAGLTDVFSGEYWWPKTVVDGKK